MGVLSDRLSFLSTKLRSASLRPQGLAIKLYFFVTISLFVTRVLLFAGFHGGIEHDSGWYLGVAKNLAHRGIYASYTNTNEIEGVGSSPSIHGGFSVQDEKGFSYFPTKVTVGPGYVLPEALLLKIFGDGWWQYRLWPLITYTGLLFLLFYFVWIIGGIWALIIFQIWLWAIPQFTTIFAYEALSEHTAFFYLLVGYFLFLKGFEAEKKNMLMFFSGCSLAFAVLTKLLFLLTLFAFVPVVLWERYHLRHNFKKILLPWLLFSFGFVLPFVFFELYRFIALSSQFGVEAWQAINKDIRLTLIHFGSGIHDVGNFDWTFVSKKLMVWADVAMKEYQILWILFLVSPVLLIGRIEKRHWIIVLVMYCAALTTFFWFVFIAFYGWTRHAWHGLLLAMMLISTGLGITLRAAVQGGRNKAFLSLLVFVAGISLVVRFDRVEMKPFLNKDTIANWQKIRIDPQRGILGLPPVLVFSLSDQQDTIDFFREEIGQKDRIYYHGRFLVAEMSPLVDKVFYPLARYFNNALQNPEGGSSYLIMGPYQQGVWSLVSGGYLEANINKYCESVVFSNPSYAVCRLKQNLK
jgi:hypothetical protein